MDTIRTESNDARDEDVSVLVEHTADIGDPPGERRSDPVEVEKRLRRDLARAREQARTVAAERDAVITSLQAASNERLIRSELQLRALQSGILDLDGLRLLDTAAITIDADGGVVGADEALASFRASKPYLFDQARAVGRTATTSAVQKAPPRSEPEPVDARQLTREQWQIERARLLGRRG